MQRIAFVALRKAAYISMAVLLLAMTPGCAVVGPLLSVGGMAGMAPLQYASTAYTVGEFSYEYAANDKDPSEVIEGKIDDILSGKAFTLADFAPESEEMNTPADTMLAHSETSPVAENAAETTMVAEADAPALSVEERQKRINRILGRRKTQFRRLEIRRMAFLKARSGRQLSLRRTTLGTRPDLYRGAMDETRLR